MGCGSEHQAGNLADSSLPTALGQPTSTGSAADESQAASREVWNPLPEAAAATAEGGLPLAFSHPVPHVQQAYNWDCGLACALMAVKALGLGGHHSMTSMMELCATRSIWTIDLAHLLAACGASAHLATLTLGANQAYGGEGFYAETILDDSERVERLFRTAAAAGIGVSQTSLPLRMLCTLLLRGSCLVIALVDKLTLCSRPSTFSGSSAFCCTADRTGSKRDGKVSSNDSSSAVARDGGSGSEWQHGGGSDSRSGGGRGKARLADGAVASSLPVGPDPAVALAAAIVGVTADRQAEAAATAAGTAAAAAGTAGTTGTAEAEPGIAAPQQEANLASSYREAAAGRHENAVAGRQATAAAGRHGPYLGHYILVCGYSDATCEFEIRDPASHSKRLWVPAARLEAARRRFGTDEDLLLVKVPSGVAGRAGLYG